MIESATKSRVGNYIINLLPDEKERGYKII